MGRVVIATCPVCHRSLALADRNGQHVASEVHYPHADASGTMVCSPLNPGEWGELNAGVDGRPRSPGGPPLRLLTEMA